jgi:hypothetical protein
VKRPRLALLLAGALLAARPARGDDIERQYRTIDTEHFHIVYYDFKKRAGSLEPLAQRLAVIAEDAHERLVKVLGPGLSRRRKTWVYLSDDTDDFNGSATVQPFPAVYLFASAPEERAELNDYDDWLRGLFLHEYTHILHIGTMGGPCQAVVNALLGWGLGVVYAPNQTAPRFIIEGQAVYEETAESTGGRLRSAVWDMYLRAATLEGKFQRIDQFSHNPIQFPFANSLYLYGSAFYRFLAQRYGDGVVRAFNVDYGSNCLPVAINRSLLRVTGQTWVGLYDEFKQWSLQRYGAQRDAIARRPITPTQVLTEPRPGVGRPVFLPDGNAVVFADSNGHDRPRLRRLDLRSGKLSTELTVDGAAGVSLSADGRLLAYHAVQPWRTFYFFNDVYLRDRARRKTHRISDGLRAANPALSPDGRQVAAEINQLSSRGLGLIELSSGRLEMLIPVNRFDQVYTPWFSPDGRRVAFSWWKEGGFRDIWIIDLATRQLTRVTEDRALDLEPRWSPDGRWLYFVSDRTGVYNVYAWEEGTGKTFQVTNVVNGLFDPAISPDGTRAVAVGFQADGYRLESFELDPATWREAAPPLLDRLDAAPLAVKQPLPSRRYNPFPTVLPFTFTPFAQPSGYGTTIGLRLSGQDLVGRHLWNAQLGFSTGRADDVLFSFNYAYRGLWPSLNFGVAHSLNRRNGLVINGIDRGYDEDAWSFGTSVSLPVIRRTVGFADLSFSYNLSYTQNLTPIPPPDPSEPLRRLPEVGRVAGLGVQWFYSNARRFTYSISPEDGRDIRVAVGVGHRALGSSYDVYSVSWRWSEYLSMPWKPKVLRNHVLALSYSGGVAGGDLRRRGLFFLGGYPQQNLLNAIFDFTRPGSASLRGYPFASISGDQFHVLNVEYRFPIAWIEHGLYKTLPLYFRRLHGKVFADYGGAFRDGFSFDKLKLGLGGEAILEVQYGYYFNAAFQLGYAYGVHQGGGHQVYFLLNSPF